MAKCRISIHGEGRGVCKDALNCCLHNKPHIVTKTARNSRFNFRWIELLLTTSAFLVYSLFTKPCAQAAISHQRWEAFSYENAQVSAEIESKNILERREASWWPWSYVQQRMHTVTLQPWSFIVHAKGEAESHRIMRCLKNFEVEIWGCNVATLLRGRSCGFDCLDLEIGRPFWMVRQPHLKTTLYSLTILWYY